MSETTTVMHVEDDPGFAEMAAEFLQNVDGQLTVTSVTDPESALSRLQADSGSVDCIVSDYEIPGMDGIELLRAVREQWPNLPFILFTGKGSEEIAAEAISAGVTDYLKKSGGTDTYEILAHRIRNAVDRQRAREEAASARRFLEKTVERATDMIAVVDTSNEVVFVSGSVKRVLGYTPEEVEAAGPFELVHPDDRERIQAAFSKRLTDPDRPTDITHRARHKDGQYVQVSSRAYNLTDDPDVNGVLIYTRQTATEE